MLQSLVNSSLASSHPLTRHVTLVHFRFPCLRCSSAPSRSFPFSLLRFAALLCLACSRFGPIKACPCRRPQASLCVHTRCCYAFPHSIGGLSSGVSSFTLFFGCTCSYGRQHLPLDNLNVPTEQQRERTKEEDEKTKMGRTMSLRVAGRCQYW